ncbi:hypothetical protein GRQ65_13325 [Nocardioides sp. YIM 123512]|uniref:Fenitrothion hydrolase n=1 Tax=Nocardioides flavescens TaxID=2691959 RepID=A0A6L7EUZ6_9ACTN|nr:hypothetical protein [Nocardioides flavescens]MXG90530.1 hypothetical protein [Nocardioides flavescens]
MAHGIGGSKDLPIPLELTIAGAVAALTVSFTVLAVAWRSPRYAQPADGRPAPAWLAHLVDARWFRVVLRVVGMVGFLYTAMVAMFGLDSLINPFFGIFYVLLWVGFVPLSLLLGPVYRAVSPVRTINLLFARLTGGDPDRGVLDYPARLGLWPAALGLYAFVWMELVYPYATELGPVRLWCAAYVGIMLIGGALFGNGFYARADPFEVYSSLAAKMSVWARESDRPDGRLVVRSPLANLATVPALPGLVAVTSVLFGSTAFDSFKDSTVWVKFIQTNGFVGSHSWGPDLVTNVALLGFVLLVALVFAIGTMLTGVGPDQPRRALPTAFAHSIVPIVIGYVVAHYLTYLLEVGEQTLIQMSDPFSTGANWFGTADLSPSYYFSYHPTLLACVKVLAVVLGHVVGVVAAHDRALALLPKRHQLTGQLSLLVAMIAFTVGGLYLLFAA